MSKILKDELANDPLSRGYAGMTSQQKADSLNAVNRDNWAQISSAQMFEAIDQTEFNALSAADQSRIDRLLGLGDGIATAPGSQARAEVISVFGGGSATVTALAGIANQQISRADELGLPTISVQMVDDAEAGAY